MLRQHSQDGEGGGNRGHDDIHALPPRHQSAEDLTGERTASRKDIPMTGLVIRPLAAGGVEASAEDMGRYLFACLSPPDSAVGHAIQVAQRPHFEIDPLRSAGLGWALGPPGYLGQDGGTSGFRSMLGIKLTTRRAAAVFVNEHDARGLALAVRTSRDAA
jgi:hypothetical protein